MKTKLLLSFIVVCFLQIVYQESYAQSDSTKIMNSINQLFDGMRDGDSSNVSIVFTKEVSMRTCYTDKTGSSKIETGNLQDFINAIGTPHEQVWDEKIFNPKIEVDENLAQVWVDYEFYVDTTYSHCGVDAFQLYKDQNGDWKIFHLADTRKKKCD